MEGSPRVAKDALLEFGPIRRLRIKRFGGSTRACIQGTKINEVPALQPFRTAGRKFGPANLSLSLRNSYELTFSINHRCNPWYGLVTPLSSCHSIGAMSERVNVGCAGGLNIRLSVIQSGDC
jgi:hypothetical protein